MNIAIIQLCIFCTVNFATPTPMSIWSQQGNQEMNQAHTLTLDDVSFDESTGTIEVYDGQYKHIVIPDNFDGIPVTVIGDYAFSEVEDNEVSEFPLTSVVIPNTVVEIGEGAFQRNALTHLVIPDSVITINDYAFSENVISSVNIPGSVIEIGEEAFSNNALINIIIPRSVVYLGDGAFSGNPVTRQKPIEGFGERTDDEFLDSL